MNIYPDNNIIIDIENGKYTKQELLSAIGLNQGKIFFSSVHLTEADEMRSKDKDFRIAARCRTISSITSNNYIEFNLDTHKSKKQVVAPSEILKRHKFWSNNTTSGELQKKELGDVTQEQRIGFRESLGIDPMEINNYTAKDVLEQYEKNKDKFENKSLSELINSASLLKLKRPASQLAKIVTTFEFLDMIGFWKDIYTEKSDFARAQDAQHCNAASVCDIFISNDRRTRNKARVVFEIYGIKTKVIDSKGIES
ncbi:MAG: hypothetical protein WC716_02295 [Chitinophagaceae bacterium]|jgi:hypothetical protein